MGVFSEDLRKRIRKTGKSHYRIALDTGLANTTVDRFMAGGIIRSDTLDVLLPYLDLVLCDTASAKTARKKASKRTNTMKANSKQR